LREITDIRWTNLYKHSVFA